MISMEQYGERVALFYKFKRKIPVHSVWNYKNKLHKGAKTLL